MNSLSNINNVLFPKINLSMLCLAFFLAFFLVFLTVAQAQAPQAYTVQLAVLDSQANSQTVRDALRQAGYTAYVVENAVQNGSSYNLRVGHFVNPQAAEQYALGLMSTPSFHDDFVKNFETGFGASFEPIVVVAEGVAQNEFPMSVELLLSYPYMPDFATLRVHEWAGQGRAVRFQGRYELANFEASYLVLNSLWDHSPFGAWRADGEPDGSLVRVFNESLWPEDIEGLSAKDISRMQQNKLEQIGDSMDLPATSFGLSIFNEPGRGRPYVVRAQRVDASSGNIESYPALGLPTSTDVQAYGPELKWFDRGFVDEIPETVTKEVVDIFGLLQKEAGSETINVVEGAVLSLDSTNWQSFAFENLTALRVQNGDSWLTVAGTPLWAFDNYLVVQHAGEVLIYRIYLTQ